MDFWGRYHRSQFNNIYQTAGFGNLNPMVVFSNESFNGSKLLDDAVFLVWTWLRAMEKDFVMQFNHWSSNLTVGFCN